jgi:hypothetical protein
MTQPKKPQPKDPQTYDKIDYAAGYNHGLFEMDAYYQPIVEELIEGLELCIKQFQDVYFCQDCGRDKDNEVIELAKQALAKYKAIK